MDYALDPQSPIYKGVCWPITNPKSLRIEIRSRAWNQWGKNAGVTSEKVGFRCRRRR